MNSFKIQFNSLIFKTLIFLSAGLFFSQSGVAQQPVDTTYINTLYDSSRTYYLSGDYSHAIRDLSRILTLKDKMPNDYKPEYFKVRISL